MRKFLRLFFYALIFMVPFFLFYLLPIGKNPDKKPLEERYKKIRRKMKGIDKSLKVDVITEGFDKLDKNQNYFFVCNHLSVIDPVSFMDVYERPVTFVAKKEVVKIPAVKTFVNCLGGLMMDREDLKQSLRVMMKVEADLKEGKRSWLIYAEGTRNVDPNANIREMHHGTFRPAVKSQTPIVPVISYGSFRGLNLKLHFKKHPIHYKVLEPITYEQYKDMSTEEISRLVQSLIQKELSFNIRRLDHEYNLKVNKKQYILNRIS